jgi:hypothetical protein
MATRRTMRVWFDYLDDPKRELTESEFMAVMLFNTREYARMTYNLMVNQAESGEHAADLAQQSGRSYPASATVREALDARRDEQRRLAAVERAKALGAAS